MGTRTASEHPAAPVRALASVKRGVPQDKRRCGHARGRQLIGRRILARHERPWTLKGSPGETVVAPALAEFHRPADTPVHAMQACSRHGSIGYYSGCRWCSCCGSPSAGCLVGCSRNRRERHGDKGPFRLPARRGSYRPPRKIVWRKRLRKRATLLSDCPPSAWSTKPRNCAGLAVCVTTDLSGCNRSRQRSR